MKRIVLFSLIAFIGLGLQAQIKKEKVDVTGTLTGITGDLTVDTVRVVSGTVNVQEVNPGGGIPTATFKIGTEGGAAAYTSASTLTLSGTFPTISNDAQLVWVKYVRAGSSSYYINGINGITLTESASVVTIAGAAGDTIATGDALEVGINAPRLEVDYALETMKNTTQNSIWTRYTDPSSLTTANDTLTTSWADVGAEIDCRGYTDVILFVTLDINAANNARLRALGKWESAGSDEYNLVIETVSATDVKIDAEYLEFNTDADQLVVIKVQTGGIPYVQIQTQEGTDGGDDAILTQPIKLVKIWK